MNNVAMSPKADSSRIWNDAEIASRKWDVLIVSARMENRKLLLHTLDGLPINSYVANTIAQAQEVLTKHPFELIFCDEFLPDGSYRQLLELALAQNGMVRVVVTLLTGEWDEYLQAMGLGATDVLRCPLQSIDVELVLIRAGRDREKKYHEMPA